MNPTEKNSLQNKKLVPLIILCITFVSLATMYVFGLAQSRVSAMQERNLKTKEFKDLPLTVSEVRNLQSESWHKDLEIEVKNVSEKPIYYILAYLVFPDDKASGGEVGIRLTYGAPENIRIKRIAANTDKHLEPGESHVFSIPEPFRTGFESRHRKYSGLDKNMLLRFAVISFGDGTGFEVGNPKDFRGKSSSPAVSEGTPLKKSI